MNAAQEAYGKESHSQWADEETEHKAMSFLDNKSKDSGPQCENTVTLTRGPLQMLNVSYLWLHGLQCRSNPNPLSVNSRVVQIQTRSPSWREARICLEQQGAHPKSLLCQAPLQLQLPTRPILARERLKGSRLGVGEGSSGKATAFQQKGVASASTALPPFSFLECGCHMWR